MRARVVSIITWPLRFLRRLLGLLLRFLRWLLELLLRVLYRLLGLQLPALRPLGKPFSKLAGLRGKPRIAALAVLGVVVVVAALALRPGPDADKQVREALDRYAKATREKDYQTLCDDLYATDLVDRIRSAGLPCEVALRTGLQDRQNPELTVLGVEVSGDQALARARTTAVGEEPSVDTIRLVREDGDWRVASLSEPGAPASTP